MIMKIKYRFLITLSLMVLIYQGHTLKIAHAQPEAPVTAFVSINFNLDENAPEELQEVIYCNYDIIEHHWIFNNHLLLTCKSYNNKEEVLYICFCNGLSWEYDVGDRLESKTKLCFPHGNSDE